MSTLSDRWNEIGEVKSRLTGIVEDNDLPEDVNKLLVTAWEMLSKAKARLAEEMVYTEPVCVECGEPLSGEDVAAGEEICLECGAALLLDEANPLLATIFVSM